MTIFFLYTPLANWFYIIIDVYIFILFLDKKDKNYNKNKFK